MDIYRGQRKELRGKETTHGQVCYQVTLITSIVVIFL